MKFKVFRAIPDLCTGCRACELACSLNKTGRVNALYARIRVCHPSEESNYTPIICRHCRVPLCLEACPVAEAMYRDDPTNAVVIDEGKCIGCLACVDACPFDAIQVGPEGEVLKCDLCGGDPMCVKVCGERPEAPFPHLSYPAASCLEYVEPHKRTKKKVTILAERGA